MSKHNGPILTIADIIKFGMSSANEDKISAMFTTANKMFPLHQTLIRVHWPQPPSPLQTDNSVVDGVTNNTILPCQTKYMDMRFYWLHLRVAQDQFRFYWDPARLNWGDHSTKHHPPM